MTLKEEIEMYLMRLGDNWDDYHTKSTTPITYTDAAESLLVLVRERVEQIRGKNPHRPMLGRGHKAYEEACQKILAELGVCAE